ncbi:FecR family protein [Chitinophaga vietnamensis]|uniref:FecR family protein n=1 Tax=Chitinophaga vietnamensis TaxID=2593957 RepID=UPI0011785F2A|nr:FecR domain-containing protein [Chitinophaga vietnamensis]
MIIGKPLIRKFLEGKCDPAEKEKIVAYLSDGKADLTLWYEVMAESWEQLPDVALPEEQAAKAALLDTLRQQLYPEWNTTVTPAKNRLRHLWYKIAASILVAGIAAWWLMSSYRTASHQQLASVVPAIKWDTLFNKSAHVKYAVLPDSTKVWLHPGGRLSFTMRDSAARRAICLQGEAFFDVKRDEAHPFMVYTGDIATKVLGTAFNVEAYAKEASIRISLVSGKVSVEQVAEKRNAALLHAGEMIDYNKEKHSAATSPLKIRSMEEWTNGYLVCNDLLITDALERVAIRYGLKVVYDKGLNLDGKRITTVFRQETVHEILDIILFVSRCNYTIKGSILEVTRK